MTNLIETIDDYQLYVENIMDKNDTSSESESDSEDDDDAELINECMDDLSETESD